MGAAAAVAVAEQDREREEEVRDRESAKERECQVQNLKHNFELQKWKASQVCGKDRGRGSIKHNL